MGVGERPTPRTQIALNVSRLRVLAGLTQETLAEKAGIDARYLQKIEAGTVNPSIRVAASLRAALSCSWDDLLRGV